MTDARRFHADQNFTSARGGELDIFDREAIQLERNQSFHVMSPGPQLNLHNDRSIFTYWLGGRST